MSKPEVKTTSWWGEARFFLVVIGLIAAVGGFFYVNHRFPELGLMSLFKGNGKTGNSSQCSMDSDCASGNCVRSSTSDHRVCASSSVQLGDTCKRDDDCASRNCVSSVCVAK